MTNEFRKLNNLVARNTKLYFKDKMTFFVSLITPLILVVLFLFFLGDVYKESLISCLPEGVELGDKVVTAFTGGWLFSSIFATSCITISFCSNMMVMDKINKINHDFQIAPVKKTTVQMSYTLANFLTTLLVCMVVLVISLIYFAIVGWYISFVDLLLILANMILCIMFGALLSSIVGVFIKGQGAYSAICTLVSSMYGFICGAYMPIQSMGAGIQGFVSFLPGTYATVLFRQGFMNGVLREIEKTVPSQAVEAIRKGFDGTFFFFGHEVKTWVMFVVMICSILALMGIYVLLTYLKRHKKENFKTTKKQTSSLVK